MISKVCNSILLWIINCLSTSSAPRRVTLLKKAYASISGEPMLYWDGLFCCCFELLLTHPLYLTDDDDINRMGEKVVLREQVKELFNKKYGKLDLSSGRLPSNINRFVLSSVHSQNNWELTFDTKWYQGNILKVKTRIGKNSAMVWLIVIVAVFVPDHMDLSCAQVRLWA